MKKVCFVGLGNMGLPMSLNLSNFGYDVTGYDVVDSVRERASSQGLNVCDGLGSAITPDTDIFLTMLPSGSDVLDVYGSVLDDLPSDCLVIDCSTIDVESCKKFHKLASSHNLLSLDAPVSGGVMGAERGSLTFMVGGSFDAFARAEDVFAPMSGKVIYCGDACSGQVAKVCNNMVLGSTMIATCEAFALGRRLGLSDQALFDVMSVSSGQSWSLTTYCPVPGPVPSSPSNNDYRAGFSVSLMTKDLGLACSAGDSVSADISLCRHSYDIYGSFESSGFGDLDFSGIIRKFGD